MARPIPNCCSTAPVASGPLMLTIAWPDRLGCAATATSSARAILARTGKALEEKIGAAVNTAKTRKKGQIKGDSQATICASVKATMSAVQPALVGTFLGILLSYAVVEPLGGLLDQKAQDGGKELQCIKTTLLASMQGYNPATAIEFGRKVLFSTERPSFFELEDHVRGRK